MEPLRKKGRPGIVRDDHICSKCFLCNSVSKFSSTMSHPHDNCVLFSEYASVKNDISIVVEPDCCICSACFVDFNRFSLKSGLERASHIPRWLKISKKANMHCFLCCGQSVTCPSHLDDGMEQP